ncbi:PaaI family thioesterase [Phreatobacter stygius]|uniref:PaaI family thioesterase n=1 Tax=Phreatobacter stygius TaxID=1940610 RepID=A0A4D7B7J7_9HYPH|nr:PaaI family thioesterase [Phreatobacter stygius]QCI63867.1 PaaI family thioesterase [Phreatobacter stygius]
MTDLPAIPHSPSAALLGWRLLACDRAKGWVRIGFDGKREFLNPAGTVQGGFLAAMLDDCMGPAAWIMTGGERYTATIDMTVSFLAPAKPGPIIGEGQVVQLGGSIAFLEARLFGPDDRVLARATSTARLVAGTAAVKPATGRA